MLDLQEMAAVALSGIGKRLRYQCISLVIAAAGLLLVASGAGFLLASTYMWLTNMLLPYEAALCTAGIAAATGVIVMFTASAHRRPTAPTASVHQAVPNQQVDDAVAAAEAVLSQIRTNPSSTMLAALAMGVIVGILQPGKR
jgi:hypothetical protein